MSLYEKLIQPIEHLGGSNPVTATDIRRCLGQVAIAMEETGHWSAAWDESDVSGSAIGDDGPPPGSVDPENRSTNSATATLTGQDEADIE